LSADVVLRADRGDLEGALAECLQGLRFVRLVLDEPGFMNALIALSGMRNLVQSLDRALESRDVPPEVLRPFFRELDSLTWRKKFSRFARAERVLFLEAGMSLLGEDPVRIDLVWGKKLLLWLARPALKGKMAGALPVYEEIEGLFGRPFFESRAAFADLDRKLEDPGLLGRGLWRLSDGQLPYPSGLSATGLKEAILEALMGVTRIGLASRFYRDREGRFPASVADLIPRDLAEEPLDPFTGKPFIFRADENGLLVYSFGSNEKDDQGRGTYLIDRLVAVKDDDWSWRDTLKK
jgi:hypothetical protein